jgi:hypothetical protein
MSDHEGLAIGHSMAEVAADNAGEAWKAEAYAAFRRHATNRSTHGRLITKWRSTIYRGKDESNNN